MLFVPRKNVNNIFVLGVDYCTSLPIPVATRSE